MNKLRSFSTYKKIVFDHHIKGNVFISKQIMTYKNFGHKPVLTSKVTAIWHTFIVFMFTCTLIEWKRLKKIFFDTDLEKTDDENEEYT